jgi:hypothetical protein
MNNVLFTKEGIVLMVLTVLLAISHYLSPYLKRISWLRPERLTSFAGGVAVGYVFLHMLPEIVEQHDRIHELLNRTAYMSPFRDLAVFIVALFGFEVFYILDRFTYKGSVTNVNASYRLNLGMYFFYNFMITYTLILRFDSGISYAILFTFAMGLHFILSDNHFKRYYPDLFGSRSHLFLILGLVAGCAFSLAFSVNVYFAAMLTSFLSGAILYNAFAEEISFEKESSPPFFFLGTAIMAGLLIMDLIHWG